MNAKHLVVRVPSDSVPADFCDTCLVKCGTLDSLTKGDSAPPAGAYKAGGL